MLLGAAQIRFTDTKTKTDFMREAVFHDRDHRRQPSGASGRNQPNRMSTRRSRESPAPGAEFAALPPAAAIAKNYAAWNKDLITWIYGSQQVTIFKCESLDATSNPNENERDFRVRLQQQAREERDRAVEELRKKYAPK